MRKDLLQNIGLIMGSVLLFFVIFELALALFYPMNLESTVYDSHLRYKNIAGWDGWLRNPQFLNNDFLVRVQHNSDGLNDNELNVSKGRRILVIGDSVTYGFGVKRNESFVQLLEGRLVDTEVINAGVPSYQLDSYLNFMIYESSKYDADLTIVMFNVGNDITDASLYDDDLVGVPFPKPPTQFRRWLARKSHAYNFFLLGVSQTSIGDFLREKGVF